MSDSSNVENTQYAEPADKPVTPRPSRNPAALILALLALLAAGWANWQLQSLRQLPARISVDSSRLAGLTRQIDTLETASNHQQQQLEDLATSLEDGLGVLPELATRIQQSEQQLASLSAMNVSSRGDWLKAEAVYYLQIANAQAMLAGDPQVAATALQFADDKLRDSGDPALTPVRAQLARDLAVLRALPQVDRAGMSLRLQALAAQVEAWPFQSSAPDHFAPAVRDSAAAADGTAWESFVATVKTVFASLVSIKKTDSRPVAQLGAEERALIIAAIKAELQLARLALVDKDAEGFRQSLLRVTAQVQQYFDVQSAAVSAALATLAQLQATELPGPLPDISGALTMMVSVTGNATPASKAE